MFKKELCSILTFYAVSPIHAGSGTTVATVDLPIQRERHTGWPHIQASEVKGALRSHFRNFYDKSKNNLNEIINIFFGSDSQDGWNKDVNLPGAISVSDAKLLAFPMRSNIAPFIWVTCPAIIKRLNNDLRFAKFKTIEDEFHVSEDKAFIIIGDFGSKEKVILEDAIVNIDPNKSKTVEFVNYYFPDIDKLLLISDTMFDYCVSSCTEIQTKIKINSKTGTTEDGSLRYQEFLPADSVLYSIVHYSGKNESEITDKNQTELKKLVEYMKAENIKTFVEDTVKDFIQIGGDETLGKGICKLKWIC